MILFFCKTSFKLSYYYRLYQTPTQCAHQSYLYLAQTNALHTHLPNTLHAKSISKPLSRLHLNTMQLIMHGVYIVYTLFKNWHLATTSRTIVWDGFICCKKIARSSNLYSKWMQFNEVVASFVSREQEGPDTLRKSEDRTMMICSDTFKSVIKEA